jgi:hypothetical protein
MKFANVLTLVSCTFFLPTIFAADAVNYELLTHRVFIDSLRAGNHDSSGTNDYYFQVSVEALRNTKEDYSLDLEKRKKVTADTLSFGDLEIQSLVTWKPEGPKPEDVVFIDMKGDDFRVLVTRAMREFSVREDEVAVIVEVSLFERGKFLYFFGEDLRVGQAKYFPIPSNQLQAPSRTNLKLSIVDDKGASVVLKVKYADPIASSSSNESGSEAP